MLIIMLLGSCSVISVVMDVTLALIQKKGRKKNEKSDPGPTLGTDIENYCKPDVKQVEMSLEEIKLDKEKKKGHIRWKGPKMLAKRVESLQASPPRRPIYVVLREDNGIVSCVMLHARDLAHRQPYLPSHMQNSGVCVRTTQR